MSARQFWNQGSFHTKLKSAVSGISEKSSGDLGKAFSKATSPVPEIVPVTEMVPELETIPSVEVSEPFDNQVEHCFHEFCERHESHHETVRKLVAGAPRQEKTDAPKPENGDKEETSPEEDVTDKETYGNMTHKVSYTENMTKNEMPCPEKKTLKEGISSSAITITADFPPDKDQLNTALRMGKIHMDIPARKQDEKEQSEEKSWISPKLRFGKSAEDSSTCYDTDTNKTKVLEVPQEKKSEEVEKCSEKELSKKPALKLIERKESPLCNDQEVKLSMKNTQLPASSESSMERKENSEENQQDINENGPKSGLDNKLLEELEALPILEHLKNQIRTLAGTLEADMADRLLKEFMEFWNDVNKIISEAAKSAPPNVCDQMKDSIIDFLGKLLATKRARCLTNQGAEDEKEVSGENKSLLEGQHGGSQPLDKLNAIEMALALSQQNKLTNATLTQIYSCFREHHPVNLEENLTCSKDFKSLMNSMNHSMKQGESLIWDSLKEDNKSMGGVSDKTAGGRRENRGLSLKSDITSLQHLSELSEADREAYRSPVENTFSFSTYASSSFLHTLDLCRSTDIGHVGRQGRDLKVILSLFQKFVRQVELESMTSWQSVSSQTAEEKNMDGQTDTQKGVDDDTENQKELDCPVDEQKGMEEKNMHKLAEHREPKMADSEEVQEKADFEEKEPKASSGTTHEADSEIREKSECEESEKAGKQQSTVEESSSVTEAGEATKQDTANADDNTQSVPAKPKRKAGSTKPTGKQKKIPQTDKRAESMKTPKSKKKGREQQQNRAKQQQKNNQRSASRKKKGHQNIRKHHAVQTKEKRQQVVKGLKTEKSFSPTKDTACKALALPLEDDGIDAGNTSPMNIPKKRSHQLKTSLYDAPHALRPQRPWTDGKSPLPPEWDWLNLPDGMVRTLSPGDSPHGASQGQRQRNGDSSNSSAGGASGAQGWGGARPTSSGNGNGGGSGGGGGDREDERPPTRKVPDSLPFAVDVKGQKGAPQRNYKRHRKKQHGALSNEQLCHCLGQAGKGMDTLRQSSGLGEVNRCLTLCLHDTRCVTSPSDDDLACCTCAILHSLLSHFSMAAHDEACTVCLQLFTLIHFHILHCQLGWSSDEDEMEESARNVCRRMRQARVFASGAGTVTVTKMWTKVRKYLSAPLGPVLLLNVGIESKITTHAEIGDHASEPSSLEASASGDIPPSDSFESGRKPPHSKDGSASLFDPSSQKSAAPPAKHGLVDPQASADPPGGHAAVMPKGAAPGSKLSRRPSTRVVPQKTIPEEPSSPHPSPTPPASPFQAEGSDQAAASDIALPSVFPRPVETPEDGEEDMMEIIRRRYEQLEEKQAKTTPRPFNDDPYATQKTYGQGGTVSMPDTRDRLIRGDQTLSVEMQPVGTPGIGEVVYGTARQLQLVAQNWAHERDRCKASGICQYQHREEGVILDPFKKRLKILRTRYQKHQQWERLVHLGNGVTGKCHLCIDRTSNFQFCCKKVHILHYEYQEMEIWSKLDHPNVVRFYGAIRHGEKIYMFAEFIDGGSLAGLIKEQLLVGRRLSHWTSLNYFRQLLNVLTYLQSVGVLHEDIKADNLLLRVSTTEIVLADFGVAQQIPHDRTPPNRYPVGSPAHWCPEKAASEGHGFTSDLWASACVLIHMLSGSPPWINRFPDAAILNYIIWSKPPPLDDVPKDVKESVRDLLSCCLVKDRVIRPSAEQILSHPAFKLLDQASSLFSIAQNSTVGFVTHATPPSVNLTQQAALQPVQAAPQPVQAAPQPVQAAPQPVQAAPQQPVQAAPQPVQAAPQQPGQAAPQPVQAIALQRVQEVPPCLQSASSQASQSMQAVSQAVQGVRESAEVPQASGGTLQQSSLPGQASYQQGQNFCQSSDHKERTACYQEQASALFHASSHPQRDAGSDMRSQGAGGQSLTALSSSEGVPVSRISPSRPQIHPVRVVEIPRRSASDRRSWPQSADQYRPPQSLPDSLASKSVKSQAWDKPQDSQQGHPPVHRKSDPGISAPITAQEEGGNVSPGRGPGPQKKQGSIVLEPSRAEMIASGAIPKKRLQRPQMSLEKETTAYNARDNWLPLQPTPLPELPSPVFSLTPQTTDLPHPSFPPSEAESRSVGRTFFPSSPQNAPVVRSTLNVPAPGQTSHSEGGDAAASSMMKEEARQDSLSSYGAAAGGAEWRMVHAVSEIHTVRHGQEGEPRVGAQHSDIQPPPMTRVGLTRSVGSPLQLYTVPQQEKRHNTGPQVLERKISGDERLSGIPTTVNMPISSEQVNVAAVQYATPPYLLTTAYNQPEMTIQADPHQDIPNQYPVMPAMSPEDFQVSASRRGIAHLLPALSMIPEGVEQESVSPSAQESSSGDSGEGTMLNYIQDQLTQPGHTEDQLLHSLRQQSLNRPRLELYAPSSLLTSEEDVRDEICRLPPTILPRFELLQSSLSDSSTLRSCKITTSSEEFSAKITTSSSEEASAPSQSNPQVQCSAQKASSPVSDQTNAYSSKSRDEPDYTLPKPKSPVQKGSGSMLLGSSGRKENAWSPVTSGCSDEERISSGDMYGAGPPRSPSFQEAFQYRLQQQQQNIPAQTISQSTPASTPQPTTTTTPSRSMLKKQPDLRLDVSRPASSTPRTSSGHPPSRDSQSGAPKTWGIGESGSSTGHSESAFLLQSGVSPMTASPVFASTPSTSIPRHSDVRPRSRNESGSSASTPKSSTFEKQEQEWTKLQQQIPGLEDALLDERMITSGSELSSSQHLSLLYESQGENSTSDKEENDVLSMLQESISNENLGGHVLVFKTANGNDLFEMRVLGKTKGWKELAMTFRAQVHNAGFRHFMLEKQDGSPVDYYTIYSSTVTSVKVIEVSEDHEDIYTICWCENHVIS